MANAVIKYDTATSMGREVQAAVAEMQSGYLRFTKVAAILSQADVATVPAVVEVGGGAGDLFGVAAGQGAAFAVAVNGLAGALTMANRNQLATLLR